MFGTFDVAGNKLNYWTRRFRKEGLGGGVWVQGDFQGNNILVASGLKL